MFAYFNVLTDKILPDRAGTYFFYKFTVINYLISFTNYLSDFQDFPRKQKRRRLDSKIFIPVSEFYGIRVRGPASVASWNVSRTEAQNFLIKYFLRLRFISENNLLISFENFETLLLISFGGKSLKKREFVILPKSRAVFHAR